MNRKIFIYLPEEEKLKGGFQNICLTIKKRNLCLKKRQEKRWDGEIFLKKTTPLATENYFKIF